MASWLTPDSPELPLLWPDVPMNDAVAALFLNAAKEACIAYAPATIPTTYEPVTVTWPTGETVTLVREGDIVTAHVDPNGVIALPITGMPFPAEYVKPNGSGRFILGPAASYALILDDGFPTPTAMQVGMIALAGPPWAPGSVQYLADPAPGSGIPDSWVLAQALQARNTYNSTKASPGGDMDGSGYGISAFPLDWQVQQLLRPRTPMGAIL